MIASLFAKTDVPKDEVSIWLDSKEFRHWVECEIELALDGHATARFLAPFEGGRKEFRDAFRPFSYKSLELAIGSDVAFTGTLVDVVPLTDANESSVEVTAYSKPGVLEDCTLPAALLPFEFNNITLRTMADTIAGAFGLETEFDGSSGAAFERVAVESTDTAHEFLARLARQRGFALSSTPDGKLWFRKSGAAGRTVARFTDDERPAVQLGVQFNPREYYSELTCYAPAKRGRVGAKYTAKNRFAGSLIRPFADTLDDTEKGDVPGATDAKLARMFANMAAYSVKVPTWFDANGDLWEPGATVALLAPSIMVYRETDLLVRSAILRQSTEGFEAELGLVLPGAFSGEQPEALPWEE